jgi:hypothetical protein
MAMCLSIKSRDYLMLEEIMKMVPVMEGDSSKCHPEKPLLPEAIALRATLFFEG